MASSAPPAFSWIIDGLLAGCGFPSESDHFQFLVDSGVRHLVTTTEDAPPLDLLPPSLKFHHVPVPDFKPPSVEQLRDVCDIGKKASLDKEGVAVHCFRGRGRTGTFLAACLVALRGAGPEIAIQDVRRARPHSIETEEQEKIIFAFSEALRKE